MKLIIKNIGGLCQIRDTAPATVSGSEMVILPVLQDAWLFCENGRFHSWGEMKDFDHSAKEFDKTGTAAVTDALGGWVLPGWCDAHTHIVFAAPREKEFVDRIHGRTYEEIAQNGGGILNSAKRLALATEEELLNDALQRLEEMSLLGTCAVEIKSGYGLTVASELKMLRVIKKLKSLSPLTIKANFLGAHAIPVEFKSNRAAYIDLIINEILPHVAAEGLADYCDVFCDRGFFSVEETDAILTAGWNYNLRPKIHANELDFSGGIQIGVKHNALSVDHLEFTGDAEIAALKGSGTMPTLLPSTAFFLKLHYAPARKMIDAGLPVALSTDYNPGSSPSGSMPFVLSLACIHMNMTPEEAVNAATLNSAYAMDLSNTHGSITKGKEASFMITGTMPSLAYLPYRFAANLISKVYVKGNKVQSSRFKVQS
jgi:imidazolonepropionase